MAYARAVPMFLKRSIAARRPDTQFRLLVAYLWLWMLPCRAGVVLLRACGMRSVVAECEIIVPIDGRGERRLAGSFREIVRDLDRAMTA